MIAPEILAQVIVDAVLIAEKAYDTFVAVNGRAPTLEEWKALKIAWKSPEEIEAEVKAQLGAQ